VQTYTSLDRSSEERETSTTGQKRNTNAANCKLILTKNPDEYTPESFQDYLNRHLKQTSMTRVSDDTSGKAPILKCYESRESAVYDGWVLDTKTEKVADIIMNHVSGKLLLSGTRLYFKRHAVSQQSAKRTNGKRQLSSPSSVLPKVTWKHECEAFIKRIPDGMTPQEVSSFVNNFMRKAGLFDRDIVIDSKGIGRQSRTTILLCVSADAAQTVVDELDNVFLKNIKLKISRYRNVRSNFSPSASETSVSRAPLSPSAGRRNQTAKNTDSTTASRFVVLSSRKNDSICLSKVMLFLDEAIIDGSCGDQSAFVGAERLSSSRYRLETDTVETASKLVKLSGIVYNSTIELVFREDEKGASKQLFSTTESQKTTVDSWAELDHPTKTPAILGLADSAKPSRLATNEDAAHLTNQVLKLLKENKELKKQNEMMTKGDFPSKAEQIDSGCHKKPIELEDSDEEVEKESSSEENENVRYHEMKSNYEKVESELEKIRVEKSQLEKEILTVKDSRKELEKQVEEAKKGVNDDYERRLHEIHESWKKQNAQIQELQDTIETLRAEKEQESSEKKDLISELQETRKRTDGLTDALARATVMVQEETNVRKAMTLNLIDLRKGKKKAERELKANRKLMASVKTEDKYDA
jgi:hypothetical protein